MSPAIVPDTLGIRVATDDTDSGVNVAPFRAAIPPNTRPTKPTPPPTPMRFPPSTTASRTKLLGFTWLIKPDKIPPVVTPPAAPAAAPAPLFAAPPNTEAALLPPLEKPVSARAAISISIPILLPVCATDRPIAAR